MPAEESEMRRDADDMRASAALAEAASDLIHRVRSRRPRVHCITNAAAQVLTANLLLAVGAIPSLTIAAEEVEAFASRADALVVNLGTLDAERRRAVPLAIAAAEARDAPVVLDPVFVEASPPRLAFARELLARRPEILRCNAAELAALSGDREDVTFAREAGVVVAVTGPVDAVTDGERRLRIANGHPLMAAVTAMGCAGTALIAAFAAVEPDRLIAAGAALAALGVAGECAGDTARGPGSFPAAFLDALASLDGQTLRDKVRAA
jgi:hydroxyethylthiazole kinase